MDRRWALAALFLIFGTAAATKPLPIREAQWLVPEQRLHLLSTRNAECLAARPDNIVLAYGRAAFRDPGLLGGQAARAGLSCASCHRSGGSNPGFHFPGLSGAPGTADVTSSLFSSHRGDDTFNPKPIPDLTRDTPKISRTEPKALENFIHGLVVEEFDGAEPPAEVINGLADYVRALDAKACKPPAARPLRLSDALGDYQVALQAAEVALDAGDRPTALAMLRSARSALGTIDMRYTDLAKPREALDEADDALAGLQQSLRSGAVMSEIAEAVGTRRKNIESWSKPLRTAEPRSLYNRKKLTAALKPD